jgi:hypothetical protein
LFACDVGIHVALACGAHLVSLSQAQVHMRSCAAWLVVVGAMPADLCTVPTSKTSLCTYRLQKALQHVLMKGRLLFGTLTKHVCKRFLDIFFCVWCVAAPACYLPLAVSHTKGPQAHGG